MVIVENMRLALEIKLRQCQRPAFDPRTVQPDEGLEVALVRYPDPSEIAFKLGSPGIIKNSLEGRTREAPPLRAQMRGDAGREPSSPAYGALK